MAKSPPSTPFYWNDYYRDTRVLSPSARGVWMDILCRLHESGRRGQMTMPLSSWLSWCSCPQDVLEAAFQEISLTEVGIILVDSYAFSVSVPLCPIAVPSLVTVKSRRMMREEKSREDEKLRKQRQRRPAAVPGSVPPNVQACPPVPSSSSSSSSSDEYPLSPPTRGIVSAPRGSDSDRDSLRDGKGFRGMSDGLRELFGSKLGALLVPPAQSDTS